MLEDLIAYTESIREKRARDLDELARAADADGLYELLDEPPPQLR